MMSSAVERNILSAMLVDYTYDDFKNQLKNWLVSGRQVWFVAGNTSPLIATELVQNVIEKLALKPFDINELGEVKTLAIEAGKTYSIQVPLEDKKNENSCSLTWFEIGPDKTKEMCS